MLRDNNPIIPNESLVTYLFSCLYNTIIKGTVACVNKCIYGVSQIR